MTDLDDDAVLLVELTDELHDKRLTSGNMTIELPPLAVLQLASVLQLARRTVLKAPPMRTLTSDLLLLIRSYFGDCPVATSILDAGDAAVPRQTTH